MPEKDGDEGKSTKSVVNKKQKQMMGEEQFSDKQRSDMKDILNKNFGSEDKSKETAGKLIKDKAKKDVERVQSGKQPNKSTPSTKLGRSSVNLNKYFGEEGYDHLRDQGRIRKTKDKKDATTMPPSKEMEKTRKVNKGPSALDIVKKKYKGQIMKMEELDLTKVAEAFGGHIVEQEKTSFQSANEKQNRQRKKFGPKNPTGKIKLDPGSKEAGERILKKIKDFTNQQGELPLGDTGKEDPVKDVESPRDIIGDRKKKGRPFGSKNKPKETSPNQQLELPLRKPRTIPFKDRKQLDPETQKKVDAVTPPFATKQGETGPLPVSMRNRRVPKTSSLSPNVKVTSIVKPTVGALTQTDTATNNIVRTGRKSYRDFVIDPEIVQQVKPKQTKVIAPEKEGETIDVTPERETQTQTGRRTGTGTPTKTDIKKLKPPKIAGYIAPEIKKPEKTDEPIADPIGGDPPNKKTKVGNFSYRPGGAFSRIRGFARRNPALSLIGYDALKNLRVPSVTKPTKTGKVSAGQ